MRTRVASEGARHAITPVHHIELVRCLRLGSSVPEARVASHPMRRVLLTAAPPSALCTLRSTRSAVTASCSKISCTVPPTPSSRRPLVNRFRLRILHLRSLKPYCVRNRNQLGLSRQGTNTVG